MARQWAAGRAAIVANAPRRADGMREATGTHETPKMLCTPGPCGEPAETGHRNPPCRRIGEWACPPNHPSTTKARGGPAKHGRAYPDQPLYGKNEVPASLTERPFAQCSSPVQLDPSHHGA